MVQLKSLSNQLHRKLDDVIFGSFVFWSLYVVLEDFTSWITEPEKLLKYYAQHDIEQDIPDSSVYSWIKKNESMII